MIPRVFALTLIFAMVWIGHHIYWGKDSLQPVIPIFITIGASFYLVLPQRDLAEE